MGIRHNLKHSIIRILQKNHDGSFQTQYDRKKRLLLIANQLVNRGYQLNSITQLKYKHVDFLVKQWLEEGKSPGTIKNRMTDIRWILSKINKGNIIPKNNDAFNIPKRQYTTNEDKSIVITNGDLSKVNDLDIKHSLLLQRAFGLRREESIKIKINQAVVGDELQLQGGWCKNGRPRNVKIQYPEQWKIIERVKAYVGKSKRALIPYNKTYKKQLNTYKNQLQNAGINKAHGLRHAYAQKLYFDLTGWDCPAKGGPIKAELSEQQRKLDKLARELISEALGHERIAILATYCGS